MGRSKTEAQAILGEKFNGIGVSDDYAAYKDLFETHQLCWAHLLRKAIKLMLQHPDQPQYATFFRDLYAIYQQAIGYQRDQRLSVGRKGKVQQLKAQIRKLCTRSGETIDPLKTPTDEATFVRLQNELLNGIEALFVVVEHPEVEATNNRSERNVPVYFHSYELKRNTSTSEEKTMGF